MGWFEIAFIYIISWWMLLMMVLPIGAGAAAEEAEENAYYSAPKRSYLKQKALATSVLAAVVTGLLAYLIQNDIITLWLPHRF